MHETRSLALTVEKAKNHKREEEKIVYHTLFNAIFKTKIRYQISLHAE